MTVGMTPSRAEQSRPRMGVWFARILWGAAALLVAAIFAAMLPTHLEETRYQWAMQEAQYAVTRWASFSAYVLLVATVRALVGGVYVAAGLLIFWRRSDDPFAIFVSATLIMLALPFGLNGNVAMWRLPAPLMAIVPWLPLLLGAVTIACLMLLLFLFPDGRFVPRQIRWIAILLTALIAIVMAAVVSPTMEYFLASLWQALGDESDEASWLLFFWMLLLGFFSGLAAQVHRYRRETDPLRRQQTRWVAWGLSAPLLALSFIALLNWATSDSSLIHAIENLLSPLLMALIPLSILFSILRYRLWQIDLWIHRTLVYGALTGAVLALYALSVGLFSRLSASSALGVALLSALIVLGLTPSLLRLARRLGDRLAPVAKDDHSHSASTGAASSVAAPNPTGLHGSVRAVANGLWLVVIGLALAFLVANTPYRLAQLSQPCYSECYGGRLSTYEAMSLASENGMSLTLYAQLLTAFTLLEALVGFGLAALIFWRKADDWMALLVALVAALSAIGGFENGHTVLSAWTTIFVALQVIFWIGLTVVLFTFPEGRFAPAWTIGLALLFSGFVLGLPVLLLAAQAFPHPIWWSVSEWYWPSAILVFFATMLAGLVIQVQRYRRAVEPARRRQLKWAVVGLSITALIWVGNAATLNFILPLMGLPWPSGGPYQLSMAALQAISAIAISLGFGVAMLGYRLWDVDFVLRRALVYGGFSVLIAFSYILVVGVLSRVFHGSELWLSVIATGVIAILFQPLRQAMQRTVNRLLYGERDDPATVLARLGQRLEGAVAAQEVLPTLVETVAQALKLPYAAVVVHQDGSAEVVVAHGQPTGQAESFPLLYQGETLGRLDAAPRAPGESLTHGDRRLLSDIAHQAGPAVHAMLLTAALQRSRERLVAAREDERLRLRRDLHDGLGPQLAALSVQIEAARKLLRRDPEAADRALLGFKAQAQEALTDIRRLVYGLRPPALDQLGLVSALQEQATSYARGGAIEIIIEAAETMPPLSAAVEVAAYRIAVEALTNVVRHAQARRCWIRLTVDNGLHLEIEDDGRGMDPAARHGVGLASMRERAEELGGVCVVERSDAGGVIVRTLLPMGSANGHPPQ